MRAFVEMVTIGSLSFGLLLSLKCILNSRHHHASVWLGFFVLLLAGSIAEFLVEKSEMIRTIIGGTYWLFGPILFFYVKLRTHAVEKISGKQLLHFTPCAVYFLLFPFTDYFSLKVLDTLEFVLYELVFIHIIIYFVMAWRINKVRGKKASTFYTLHDRMAKSFLTILSIGSLILFGGSWVLINTMLFTGWQSPPLAMEIIQLGLCLMILIIALFNTESSQHVETVEVH